LLALPKGLLFSDKHGRVDDHLLRTVQIAAKNSDVMNIKLHRFRDTFITNKIQDGVNIRTVQIVGRP